MIYSMIIMLGLIVLSGIFTAAEVALVVISDSQVNLDAEKGNKRALKIQIFTGAPKSYLTTIRMLVTLIILINGAIALDTFTDDVISWFDSSFVLVEPLVIAIIVTILLIFQVVLGQMIPKRLGNKYANRIAYGTIGLVTSLKKLFSPMIWMLNAISSLVGRLFGLNPNEGERKMTEEDIRSIIETSGKTGNIDEEESEMIQNIFDFSDTTVDEIMTHRTEISALNVRSSKAQVIGYVKDEKFTRFPVYEGDIDHIIGILHVKDLLKYIDNNDEKFSIKALIRPPHFIPDSKKTSELFKDMQKQKNHIAVVLDEYGGTAGIVTIEDLIEEIVGNIFDEYDEIEEDIKTIDENTYEIEGLCNIHDVEDSIEAGLPVDEYDTLSGFILGQLGRFPDEDEHIELTYNGFSYVVLNIEDKVISKVRVIKPLRIEDDVDE